MSKKRLTGILKRSILDTVVNDLIYYKGGDILTTHFLRSRLRCNQKQFAQLLGVDFRTVTNWDSRDTFPVYLSDLLEWIMEDEATRKRFMERLEEVKNGR